ncbi:MAG: phytanoyl-CoA dioxygenase family protein [Acidobacteriota bacterium]
MLPRPKRRPLWQRTLLVLGVMFMASWKALRIPTKRLPIEVQKMIRHWHPEMFRVLIRSWLTRTYIDEPCQWHVPEPITPKAEVEPAHRLSPEQLDSFYRDGYLGPFDLLSGDEAERLREELLALRETQSPHLGIVTDRDRHLDSHTLRDLLVRPEITDRVAQLLGPDLLCWRSQFFYKPPGGRPIEWHQESTFLSEDYIEPAIHPPDLDELFQLTVWIAFDSIEPENGALHFIPGSQDRIRTIRFGGESSFYHVNFSLEFDHDPSKVATMSAEPGQFFIFTGRMIHGSGPNHTDRARLAYNFRVVPTHVPAHTDRDHHHAMHMGQIFDLDHWGVMVIRGEDRHQLSRPIPD